MTASKHAGRGSGWFRHWFRATRASFLPATLLPVSLAAVVARYDGLRLEWGYAALTLLGVVSVHFAINMANDYFDHWNGTDAANPYRTPFNGGAGMIQSGEIKPRTILHAVLGCLVLAFACGAWLATLRGAVIWALMVAGFVLGIGYSATPLSLMKRGWGEVVAGLCCGPLLCFGSYYAFVGRGSWTIVWASLPLGLLISAILVINELPDVEADRGAGKDNLVVRYGKRWGAGLHRVLVGLAYAALLLCPLARHMPWQVWIALLTVPLALRVARVAREHVEDPVRIIPANAGTVQLHMLVGLSLVAGYLLDGVR